MDTPQDTTADITAAARATSSPTIETVTLEEPVVRGKQKIAEIGVRKPKAGELRGINLQAVMQGDANAMIALLPRITVPPLMQNEVEGLDAADFATLTGTVMGFFYTKAEQAMIAQMQGRPISTS